MIADMEGHRRSKILSSTGCQFIRGDLAGDWRYCGRRFFRRSYCSEHYRLCYLEPGSTDYRAALEAIERRISEPVGLRGAHRREQTREAMAAADRAWEEPRTTDAGSPDPAGRFPDHDDKTGDKQMTDLADEPDAETIPIQGTRTPADPIWSLVESGELLLEHRQAVLEIREVVAYITQPVAIRASNLLRVPGKHQPGERESHRLVRLKKRYLDWIDRLGRQGLPTWPVFDIVIEEVSLRTADRRRRKRHGTTKRLLIEALDLYCAMAGWASARDAAQ